MITKLTPKQEKQIPIFIDKYLKLAEKPTDRIKAKEAVENLYVKAGYKKPIVIFGKNPIQTAIMVVMCKILFKDKKIDLIKDAYQLRSQLRSQLDSQLSSQLRSQLSSQLRSQLRSQLSSQLRSQLSSQLASQLRSQLSSQLASQLSSQLRSQLDSQLSSQLDSQLRSQLDSQLSKLNNDWWLLCWWLVWAGWYAYSEYIGVKFDKKIYKLFMDFVKNISFLIPYDGIVFISETPQKISWNNGRLHSVTEPAVKYDGDYGLYAINGVTFP